jgi:pimeloyl-ACP methyl ester carboxylesterase
LTEWALLGVRARRIEVEIKLIAGNENSAVRHLVFLHGLGGSSQATWVAGKNTKQPWTRWLAEDFAKNAVWHIDYPAGLSNWFGFVPQPSRVARALLGAILNHPQLRSGEIVFIAHSLGGLVVKQLLVTASSSAQTHADCRNLLTRTKRVVFFGTPHRGSYGANLLVLFGRMLRPSNPLTTLAVGNEFLLENYETYKNLAKAQPIRQLPFIEGKPLRLLGVFDLPIVPHWSGDCVDEPAQELIDEDHKSMCKLASKKSIAYMHLHRFLTEQAAPPLPVGFERPEWIEGSDDGLRARLRADQQRYIEAGDDFSIASLAQHFDQKLMPDEYLKPIVIIGDGGFGKTRLALELYRQSGREGFLINGSARQADFEQLVKEVANGNREALFLIDYLEEMQGNFDDFYDTVVRCGKNRSALIVTTRQLPSPSARGGPQKLNGEHCQIIDLNAAALKPWRRQVCREILQAANVPDEVQADLADLDNPAIATLVAYDFSRHGIHANEALRAGDSGWLINRLKHGANSTASAAVSDKEFVHLLTLYPFTAELRDQLAPNLREAADRLERQGWVSRSSGNAGAEQAVEWRLGHDLLSDIPLVDLLMSEQRPALRYELLQRLAARAAVYDPDRSIEGSEYVRFVAAVEERCSQSYSADKVAETSEIEEVAMSVAEEFTAGAVMLEEFRHAQSDSSFYGARQGYARALRRSLRRLIAATPAPQILDTLEACADPLTAGLQSSLLASQACRLAINSVSLDLFEKLSVLQAAPSLSAKQIVALLGAFAEGSLKFQALAVKYPEGITALCQQAAQGSISRQNLLQTYYGLAEPASQIQQPSDEVRGAFIPSFHFHTIKSYWISLQNTASPDVDGRRNPSLCTANGAAYKNYAERDAGLPSACSLSNDARLWIAEEAFNIAKKVAGYLDDPFPYGFFITRFAEDDYRPVRELAAEAAFNKANDIAERDSDPSAYDPVITRFAEDDYGPAREQAVRAAFKKAIYLVKRDNDLRAYDEVIASFAGDDYGPVRELVAKGACNQAYNIAKRDSDPSAYDQFITRFAEDAYGPVREQAARAALNKANDIAERDHNPNVCDDFINRFIDDSYAPIQQLVVSARMAQVGWTVVARNMSAALLAAEGLLQDQQISLADKVVVAFLAWLAEPSSVRAEMLNSLADELGVMRTTWTFHEFADLIATFAPEDQVFAQTIIERLQRLEQRSDLIVAPQAS